MMSKAPQMAGLGAALAWSFLTFAAAGVPRSEPSRRSEAWQIPEGAERERNPVPADAAVIASGQRLYRSKCQRCHGAGGTGNGPDADGDHAPGNLTDASRGPRNPDGVLFYKIWNGRTKPRMPAMKSEIDPIDVWTIIHYVKTLRRGDPAPGR
jgi:mono/diheme cytochrome c family protein